MYICITCTYVRMYVCMYLCMYVCIYQLFLHIGSAPILETSFHVSGVGNKASHRPAGASRGKAASASSFSGTVAASINSDYLLLVGRGGGGDRGGGAQGKDGHSFNRMTAWDSLYGTKQGSGDLRWESEEGSIAHYSNDKATAVCASEDGSLVAVALEKCVVVCSVQSSAMSMEMVVAAAASMRENTPALPSAAMRPVDVLACMAMADEERDGGAGEAVEADGARARFAQAVQEGNRRESAILKQISEEGNNWVEAMKLYLEDLQAESVNTEAARRSTRAQPSARPRRGGGGGAALEGGGGGSWGGRAPVRVAVSEEVLDAVMRRCCEKGPEGRFVEGKFDGALLVLVQAGAVTMRASSEKYSI